jgi:hypothetical protein
MLSKCLYLHFRFCKVRTGEKNDVFYVAAAIDNKEAHKEINLKQSVKKQE